MGDVGRNYAVLTRISALVSSGSRSAESRGGHPRQAGSAGGRVHRVARGGTIRVGTIRVARRDASARLAPWRPHRRAGGTGISESRVRLKRAVAAARHARGGASHIRVERPSSRDAAVRAAHARGGASARERGRGGAEGRGRRGEGAQRRGGRAVCL